MYAIIFEGAAHGAVKGEPGPAKAFFVSVAGKC